MSTKKALSATFSSLVGLVLQRRPRACSLWCSRNGMATLRRATLIGISTGAENSQLCPAP
jgi:hypothetical protein